MEKSDADANSDVRCPKCESTQTAKRFFGKKSKLVCLVCILFGGYWLVRSFQMLSESQGAVTLGIVFLWVFGLAAITYAIAGLVGKHKCKNCGHIYP